MIDEIELRHELHKNPELAFSEFKTQKILESALRTLGLNPTKVAGTGLVVYVEHSPTRPSILYRADMDGLPITEATGCEFSSTNHNMHACGHDVHMAVLYGTVKRILERGVDGNFVFVFQPAEETIGGAKYVLQELRERFKVKYATALHVTDEFRVGQFASTKGTLFASAMEVTARFAGRSAHVAEKHLGDDALQKATRFLTEYYESFRDVAECGKRTLVAFGRMTAGRVRNQVPDLAVVEGSIRGEDLWLVLDRFEELRVLVERYGGTLERGSFYPPVVNAEPLVDAFREFVTSRGFDYVDCGLKFTGEDFGFFSLKYPSIMFWAGVGDGRERVGLHNPHFLPSDEVVPHLADFMTGWLEQLWSFC